MQDSHRLDFMSKFELGCLIVLKWLLEQLSSLRVDRLTGPCCSEFLHHLLHFSCSLMTWRFEAQLEPIFFATYEATANLHVQIDQLMVLDLIKETIE